MSRLREELAALLGVEVGEVAGPRVGGRASRPYPPLPSSSAPRRCCTGCAAPPPWPSSTSICICWRRASRPPRRPWPCSSGPPGWSAPAGRGRPGPACRRRRGCRITPCCRRSPGATRRRCWRKRWRSAACPRCRPSLRWPWCRVPSPPPTPRRCALRSTPLPGGEAVAGAPAVTLAPLGDERFLLRAETHEPLCDLLARTPRPPGRGLRVEVDPVTL